MERPDLDQKRQHTHTLTHNHTHVHTKLNYIAYRRLDLMYWILIDYYIDTAVAAIEFSIWGAVLFKNSMGNTTVC